MILTMTLRLKLAFRHDKETGMNVGFCPNLKIYSQGKTEEEAQESLKSAVLLFFKQCLKRGVLERVLKEHGFTEVEDSASVSLEESKSDFVTIEKFDTVEDVDIPIYLRRSTQECQQSALLPQ